MANIQGRCCVFENIFTIEATLQAAFCDKPRGFLSRIYGSICMYVIGQNLPADTKGTIEEKAKTAAAMSFHDTKVL